jgi:uncharacterized protein with NRDE domain
MCIALVGLHPFPACDFIIGFNRDESYCRPSRPFGLIEPHWGIYGGFDYKSQGTWLGIREDGTIAAILHHRDPALTQDKPMQRGRLVGSFLSSGRTVHEFCASIETSRYRPFYLIVGNPKTGLWTFSSLSQRLEAITSTWQAFSNGPPEQPWPKTRQLTQRAQCIDPGDFDSTDSLHDRILHALSHHSRHADSDLPRTGIPLEHERALSATFVQTPKYGTVSQTVVSVSTVDHRIWVTERITDPESPSVMTRCILELSA